MKVSRQVGDQPSGEAYIQTSTLQSFVAFAGLLTATRDHTAVMGVAVGAPGIGKSASLLYYEDLLARRKVQAKAISIRVYPCSTPNSLTVQLFGELGEPIPAGRNANKLDAIAAVARFHDLRLVMLDEAHRLNDKCLDLLCSLFDTTGCPCLLVGLPSLLRRCQEHTKLWRRVGMDLKLTPLSFEEVLYRVLPALEFPGWEFDPTREADCLLAEQLWEGVSPSLRRLRIVLWYASRLAHMQHEPRITGSCIQQALQLLSPPPDRADTCE